VHKIKIILKKLQLMERNMNKNGYLLTWALPFRKRSMEKIGRWDQNPKEN